MYDYYNHMLDILYSHNNHNLLVQYYKGKQFALYYNYKLYVLYIHYYIVQHYKDKVFVQYYNANQMNY